jgi:hypothetical protein
LGEKMKDDQESPQARELPNADSETAKFEGPLFKSTDQLKPLHDETAPAESIDEADTLLFVKSEGEPEAQTWRLAPETLNLPKEEAQAKGPFLRTQMLRVDPQKRKPKPTETLTDEQPESHRSVGAEKTSKPAPIEDSEQHPESFQLSPYLAWPLDLVLALAIFWIAWTGIVTTYAGYGHSWDEALYLRPGEKAVAWWDQLLSGDRSMLEKEQINAHWGTEMGEPLHPEVAPIPKYLIGLGSRQILAPPDGSPLTASRLPTALLFASMIALVYLMAAREGGRVAGLAASVALGMAPRVFGHGHIAASETPLLFSMTALLAIWVVGTRYWLVGLLFAGPALGLALATKITAVVLPFPLMLWALLYRRRDFGPAAFSLMFLAPLTTLLLWPWFWTDAGSKLAQYIHFYTNHPSPALWFLGRPWGYIHGPLAPWYYPLVMIAVGLPEWVVLFFAVGFFRALWNIRRNSIPVLWILVGATWLALASTPNSPKYDGDRLFLPIMVPLALLASHGFVGLLKLLFERRLERGPWIVPAQFALGLAILGGLGWLGTYDLKKWQGAHLNYFNRFIGGAEGAKARGFETTYWGEAIDERVLAWLSEATRETSGGRVQLLAMNHLALENMQAWDLVPRDIDFTPDGPPPFDYIVIHAREGFHGRVERDAWSSPAVAEFESGGLVRARILDGHRFFREREKQPAVGGSPPPLTVIAPIPAPASPPVIPQPEADTPPDSIP